MTLVPTLLGSSLSWEVLHQMVIACSMLCLPTQQGLSPRGGVHSLLSSPASSAEPGGAEERGVGRPKVRFILSNMRSLCSSLSVLFHLIVSFPRLRDRSPAPGLRSLGSPQAPFPLASCPWLHQPFGWSSSTPVHPHLGPFH